MRFGDSKFVIVLNVNVNVDFSLPNMIHGIDISADSFTR